MCEDIRGDIRSFVAQVKIEGLPHCRLSESQIWSVLSDTRNWESTEYVTINKRMNMISEQSNRFRFLLGPFIASRGHRTKRVIGNRGMEILDQLWGHFWKLAMIPGACKEREEDMEQLFQELCALVEKERK